jgi:hypothetical protein
MKTFPRRLSGDHRVRNACLLAAAALFLLSVFKLLSGVGGDVGLWRGVALASLYVSFCLMQRRVFTPPSKAAPPLGRRGQLLD